MGRENWGRWNTGTVNVDAHPEAISALYGVHKLLEKRERRKKKKRSL